MLASEQGQNMEKLARAVISADGLTAPRLRAGGAWRSRGGPLPGSASIHRWVGAAGRWVKAVRGPAESDLSRSTHRESADGISVGFAAYLGNSTVKSSAPERDPLAFPRNDHLLQHVTLGPCLDRYYEAERRVLGSEIAHENVGIARGDSIGHHLGPRRRRNARGGTAVKRAQRRTGLGDVHVGRIVVRSEHRENHDNDQHPGKKQEPPAHVYRRPD